MKRWWRTDEELMKNWWRGDEELMKNWWRTVEDYHRLPQTATDWLVLLHWTLKAISALDGMGYMYISLTPPTTRAPLAVLIIIMICLRQPSDWSRGRTRLGVFQVDIIGRTHPSRVKVCPPRSVHTHSEICFERKILWRRIITEKEQVEALKSCFHLPINWFGGYWKSSWNSKTVKKPSKNRFWERIWQKCESWVCPLYLAEWERDSVVRTETIENHFPCVWFEYDGYAVTITIITVNFKNPNTALPCNQTYKGLLKPFNLHLIFTMKDCAMPRSNIARGTTDPGYRIYNLSYLSS